MDFFSDETLRKIAQKIEKIEKDSGCELVVVFARRSDDYFYIPLLWAALGALVLSMLFLPWLKEIDVATYGALQALLFFLLAISLRLDAVLPRIIPAKIRERRAAQMAYTQFVSRGLNSADAPPAVLFFISFDERYARILTNAKVPIEDVEWQKIIDAMTQGIAEGKLQESVLEAIAKIGDILQSHCPATGTRDNRFSNHMVIV